MGRGVWIDDVDPDPGAELHRCRHGQPRPDLDVPVVRIVAPKRGRVQDRDRLLNEVWGYESVIDTRTVDTHVRRLREKLGKAGDAIETVRGFGYRLRENYRE